MKRSIRWRCHACQQTFSAWAAVQRHVDDVHGHGRIECLDLGEHDE